MAVPINSSFDGPRIVHRSIVKQISQTDSVESGCVSVGDNEKRNTMDFSVHIESSVRTVAGGSEPDIRTSNIYCNSRNTSTGSLPRRSTFVSLQSPSTQCKFQRLSRERLRSVSPNSCLKTNKDDQSTSIIPSRTQSIDALPLPPLRETTTGDSGTGDSITQPLVETSTPTPHYETVPVYGLKKLVLMANRYEFDPTKVTEYGRRTPKGAKPPRSGIKTKSRQNSNNSTKLFNPFSHLLNRFALSSPGQASLPPMVRYHPSHSTTDANY